MKPRIREVQCTWEALIVAVGNYVEQADADELAPYDADRLEAFGRAIRTRLEDRRAKCKGSG